ncbi:UNVERIFIED_CONTAM: hypothetical protein NCL1_51175 [Trichonephila clavipes]
MKGYFWYLNKTRTVDSTRHSKPDKKMSRKKERPIKTVKVRNLCVCVCKKAIFRNILKIVTETTVGYLNSEISFFELP